MIPPAAATEQDLVRTESVGPSMAKEIEQYFNGHGGELLAKLLSAGVQRAWDRGARRVWVHTCTLDGPNALANYCARGFRVFDQTVAAASA